MVSLKSKSSFGQVEGSLSFLVNGQSVLYIPEFELECGVVLKNVPVAYKTWGKLDDDGSNVMVICHAFTGSADVADWWGPLLGEGRAFDTSKFFVVCCNVLGSPYGTASALTINPNTGKPYGPDFPLVSIRDDIRLHKLVLDHLKVNQIAVCIGGSLGGMQVLEWATFGKDYVKVIIPIATSGKHSAWGISWGEAQRQAIYSDPNYCDGYYTPEKMPKNGLGAARMTALLTYRSRNSFESRFGRKIMTTGNVKHYLNHVKDVDSTSTQRRQNRTDDRSSGDIFSAQSYLRYQGDKFTKRFDANCYISLTKKMDTHDLGRDRGDYVQTLKKIEQPALVVGIESDGLFTINEQYELAEHIPNAQMVEIESPDGHDGFLLEFEQLNTLIKSFIKENLPQYASTKSADVNTPSEYSSNKASVFGESETDVLKW
ncbi:homoserine O- acetyltransferase [Mycoemilia scoparia]|uniref:Homoserine O- acetyltransferase n=1 Tax=Mycoemilia scoparia TaxID=417184 RepID=A0A9W7ZZT7_9FUNG|nr:homoserine O- acetyltransferase [Mycoemilia scoparia]